MSEIKVDTLTGKTTANDITVTVGATATMSLEQGLAKGWYSMSNWGTADDSLNVSSISDNSAGQSTVTWSNAFASANYTVAGASSDADGVVFNTGSGKLAATCDVRHYGGLAGSASYVDSSMSATFNGDLA